MRTLITSSSLAALAIAASAVFAAPSAAVAQIRDAYCLTDSDSGAVNCSYQSMSQCEQSKTGSTDSCGRNPDIGGTVGFGGSAPSAEGRAPLRGPQPEPGFTR